MSENDRMYELEYPAPGIGDGIGGVPLVIALQGYADAGRASNRRRSTCCRRWSTALSPPSTSTPSSTTGHAVPA